MAELLDALDPADSGCEFGAEQAAIGGLIGEPTHGRKPLIDEDRPRASKLMRKRVTTTRPKARRGSEQYHSIKLSMANW